MSLLNRAVGAVVARFSMACDGAFLGITLACYAVRSWANYFMLSSALRRIQAAPNSRVSDLRSSLLNVEEDDVDGPLVVVRGSVQPKHAFDRWRMAFPFVSRSVVVQRIQTCLYNERAGLFDWKFDLLALLFNSIKEHELSSLSSIPFVLEEASNSDYVTVNLDGSTHELPLATVSQNLNLVQPSLYTLLQAFFGAGCPLFMLKEEKILPIKKEITAVGICTRKGGAVEIKSCSDLPFFLSDMTKGEIEAYMASKTRTHFFSGALIGTISLGILGYVIHRNWLRWKEWTERRRETISESNGHESDDETGNVAEECQDSHQNLCFMRY
ncbi:hypothetical protein J5N97_005864 [Dioscorea zingiberensis]|uniref:RING-type E3 ubiquitin transferase n=1 Tax=Dioscorea zingiberensis TaxID=325984 RepID=A0A9D5D953_9LILI|nr:hypothetical protein J5N97_005864 [Dioscorea zingiberensis]